VDILLAGGASGIPLLVKPFKVAELRRRVMEALHPGSPDLALVRSHSRLLAASI
jgi:hypothetical protein